MSPASSLKTLFKYVNSKLQVRQHIPPLRDAGGHIITSDDGKAELLNEQFDSVFTIDNNVIPIFLQKTVDSLSSINFDEEIVLQCILKLRPDSSGGPDQLSPMFLQRIADIVCHPMCKLFKNLCVQVHYQKFGSKQISLLFIKAKGQSQTPAIIDRSA